jgi:arylsulfatase A-like enzyme
VSVATSHVDVLPTLLGLTGVDVAAATDVVAEHHVEVQPLCGRDLSSVLLDGVHPVTLEAPVYFMTEDEISKGLRTTNPFTGFPFTPVPEPAKVETVIASMPNGGGGAHTWKLNHYYDRLDDWEAEHGLGAARTETPATEEWELHDLTSDPEERRDLARDGRPELEVLQKDLATERDEKRRVPTLRNPSP